MASSCRPCCRRRREARRSPSDRRCVVSGARKRPKTRTRRPGWLRSPRQRLAGCRPGTGAEPSKACRPHRTFRTEFPRIRRAREEGRRRPTPRRREVGCEFAGAPTNLSPAATSARKAQARRWSRARGRRQAVSARSAADNASATVRTRFGLRNAEGRAGSQTTRSRNGRGGRRLAPGTPSCRLRGSLSLQSMRSARSRLAAVPRVMGETSLARIVYDPLPEPRLPLRTGRGRTPRLPAQMP